MSSFGATELLIVLVIVLLIFGPKRLPALGRQLGSGIREFRRSIGASDDHPDDRDDRAGADERTAAPGDTAAGDRADDRHRP